jgi:hypothetical protein
MLAGTQQAAAGGWILHFPNLPTANGDEGQRNHNEHETATHRDILPGDGHVRIPGGFRTAVNRFHRRFIDRLADR